MLTLVKLFPKYGLSRLWKELEAGRKHLKSENITPVFAFLVEGKGHVSIMLDVKSIDAIQEEFLVTVNDMVSLRKTETTPLLSPKFFPVKEGVDYTLERYVAYLEVEPGKYEEVYKKILNTKFTDDTYARWLAYSLGKEDIILFVFSDDREATNRFLFKNVEHLGGVKVLETERVFKFMPILSTEEFRKVKEPFVYTAPPGYGGTHENRQLYVDYRRERSDMMVIVRLWATGNLKKLWQEIEADLGKFTTDRIKPLYATQSEGKSHLSILFEIDNFEVLRKFLVENVHTLKNLRQTWTIPLLEPRYFDLPDGHPQDMERYLISVRVDPMKLSDLRAKLEKMSVPGQLYMTFIAYSLGEYDIFCSVLATSRGIVQDHLEEYLDGTEGLIFYNITSQQKLIPFMDKAERGAHKKKFMY